MKKAIAIITILILLTASLPLVSNAEKVKIGNNEVEYCGVDQEINLLRGEHYLYFDVNSIRYFPSRSYGIPADAGGFALPTMPIRARIEAT